MHTWKKKQIFLLFVSPCRLFLVHGILRLQHCTHWANQHPQDSQSIVRVSSIRSNNIFTPKGTFNFNFCPCRWGGVPTKGVFEHSAMTPFFCSLNFLVWIKIPGCFINDRRKISGRRWRQIWYWNLETSCNNDYKLGQCAMILWHWWSFLFFLFLMITNQMDFLCYGSHWLFCCCCFWCLWPNCMHLLFFCGHWQLSFGRLDYDWSSGWLLGRIWESFIILCQISSGWRYFHVYIWAVCYNGMFQWWSPAPCSMRRYFCLAIVFYHESCTVQIKIDHSLSYKGLFGIQSLPFCIWLSIICKLKDTKQVSLIMSAHQSKIVTEKIINLN